MPAGLVAVAELPLGVVVLEAEPLVLPVSAGGVVVVVDDDDEAPGTTIVSFSLVTVLVEGAGAVDGAGMTVVSFFSHALKAKAAAMMIRYPLCFMSTPFVGFGKAPPS